MPDMDPLLRQQGLIFQQSERGSQNCWLGLGRFGGGKSHCCWGQGPTERHAPLGRVMVKIERVGGNKDYREVFLPFISGFSWLNGVKHILNCSVAPFSLFLVAAPLKMVFPKKGSLFSRITEELSIGAQQGLGPN